MTNFSTDPYYRWWYGIEKSGTPIQAIKEYYTQHDAKHLFSITFDDETFTYSILTKDDWQWVTTPPYEFSFNSELKQTKYEWYHILSAISRMSYAADETTITTIDELEDYVWNGDLYAVEGIKDTSVSVIKSDFYSVLSSAEPYIGELNAFLYNSGISQATTAADIREKVSRGVFPIRDASAQTLEDILQTAENTQLPIGGTYPVLLQTKNGFECIVSERSTDVNSWPGYKSVLPAGYFSPDGIDSRLGVLNQFYSEYCEELFSVSEGSVSSHSQRVQDVEQKLAAGKSEFAVTGLGVEAVGLAFQATGTYIVYDVETSEAIKNGLEGNYEVGEIEFLSLDDVDAVKSFLEPSGVTPPTAFSFANALQYLKSVLPEADQPESVKQFS